MAADPGARRAISAALGADDLERLLNGLGVEDPALAQGLRNALRSGRAFDATTTRMCGGEISASARSEGRRIAMTLRLNPPSASGPGMRSLTRAAETAEHPIWLRGADGSVRWRNRACARLDLEDARMRVAAATAAAANAAQSLRVKDSEGQTLTVTESPGGLGLAAPERTEDRAERSGGRDRDAAAAMERLTLGVAVFGPGRRLTCANAAFRDFWSLSTRELDGLPRFEMVLDRMRGSGRLPAVANYPLWREEVAEWADPLAEAPDEDDWNLADGTAIRITRSVDDAARVFLCFRDVTAEILLERRFRRIVSIQRRTLDALEDGVALLDPDGRLRLANPAFAELWTLDPAQVRIGAHIAEIPAPTSIGAAAQAWTELKLAVTGGAGRAERRFRLGGRVLQASTTPMPDGSILACIDDRTAAERAETALRERGEALEAAAELRTALADCASVKLRTALTSISGFAELMTLDCASPQQRAQLHAILSATADMAKAIDEIEHLTAEAEADTLPASALLSLTRDLLSRALWAAEARLEHVSESEEAVFFGDTVSLRQIALAMAMAALDGAPPGGVLRLTAGQSGPDRKGRCAATLTAEMEGPPDRPTPGARLARAFALAERIGATLTATDDGGRRVIVLTSALSGA